jgi:hypothetical protein
MRPGLKAMKATDAVLALLNDDDDDINDSEEDEMQNESEDDEDDLPLSVLVKKSTENSVKKSVGAKEPIVAGTPQRILSDKTNRLNNSKHDDASICKSASSKESKYKALKSNYVLKNLFSFLCNITNEKENLNLKEEYVAETSDEEDTASTKNPQFQGSIDLTKSPSIKLLQMSFQREKVAISSPVFALNMNNNKRKRI